MATGKGSCHWKKSCAAWGFREEACHSRAGEGSARLGLDAGGVGGSITGGLCLLCGGHCLAGTSPGRSGSKTQKLGFVVGGFVVRFLCTFNAGQQGRCKQPWRLAWPCGLGMQITRYRLQKVVRTRHTLSGAPSCTDRLLCANPAWRLALHCRPFVEAQKGQPLV